jgi:hypothetical protein
MENNIKRYNERISNMINVTLTALKKAGRRRKKIEDLEKLLKILKSER